MREQLSKVTYSGRFVQVKETTIDGYVWEQAYFPDSLVVFPFDDNGELIMIEERRPHENKPIRLKFVTGHIHPGEGVLDTANRELMEEVGLEAGKLSEFMKHESSGTINTKFHYVIAKNLSPNKIPNPDGEDTIVSVLTKSLKEIERMIYMDELEWNVSTLGVFKILNAHKSGRLEDLFN